jgi:hypothetical protein
MIEAAEIGNIGIYSQNICHNVESAFSPGLFVQECKFITDTASSLTAANY